MTSTNEHTKSKYSEEKLHELTHKLMEACLQRQGYWVTINNDHGKVNQEEIFDRVRNIFKLMGISYAIPTPIVVGRGDSIYKIKIMTPEQLLLWKQDRRKHGTFSERNGWQDPTWKNDFGRF